MRWSREEAISAGTFTWRTPFGPCGQQNQAWWEGRREDGQIRDLRDSKGPLSGDYNRNGLGIKGSADGRRSLGFLTGFWAPLRQMLSPLAGGRPGMAGGNVLIRSNPDAEHARHAQHVWVSIPAPPSHQAMPGTPHNNAGGPSRPARAEVHNVYPSCCRLACQHLSRLPTVPNPTATDDDSFSSPGGRLLPGQEESW